jgi:hypothetical protein
MHNSQGQQHVQLLVCGAAITALLQPTALRQQQDMLHV